MFLLVWKNKAQEKKIVLFIICKAILDSLSHHICTEIVL